jgi:hypothetical protein
MDFRNKSNDELFYRRNTKLLKKIQINKKSKNFLCQKEIFH